MSTPRERLEEHKAVFAKTVSSPDGFRPFIAASNIDCAIEITESLISLRVAVDSAANQAFIVMSNLTSSIEKATAQAVISAEESTKVAKESTKLASQLNRLTKWVIGAAVLAAVAAAIQAYAALYLIIK